MRRLSTQKAGVVVTSLNNKLAMLFSQPALLFALLQNLLNVLYYCYFSFIICMCWNMYINKKIYLFKKFSRNQPTEIFVPTWNTYLYLPKYLYISNYLYLLKFLYIFCFQYIGVVVGILHGVDAYLAYQFHKSPRMFWPYDKHYF